MVGHVSFDRGTGAEEKHGTQWGVYGPVDVDDGDL